MYNVHMHKSISVNLRRLFPAASFVGCADAAVAEATDFSGDCSPGCLFAAIPGSHVDGRTFVDDAVRRGASVVLTNRPLSAVEATQCVVPDVRKAYSELCQALYGFPTRRLGTVGITGTNGKTTVSWLIRGILESSGQRTGLLGTVEYSDGIETAPAGLTTPASKTLAEWLSSMVLRNTRMAVMELSSHALEQSRAAGVMLDAAVVTNVTQDHFDYHGGYAAYIAAKANIFDMLKRGGLIVLNADDAGSASMIEVAAGAGQVCTFGVKEAADVTARILSETADGTRFVLQRGVETCEVRTPLIGQHNVSNCLAAAAAASHFGVSLKVIAEGIEGVAVVPGRLERIDGEQLFHVFVDYGHTEDALQRALAAVRTVTVGRVICVVGAGGDRDCIKRPLMGKALTDADLIVITSDNPRTESPRQIAADILAGIPRHNARVHVELDREAAIAWAIESARPGDSVVIAGKGHESVQIIGSERIPFDDRDVSRRLMRRSAPHTRRGGRLGAAT